MIWTGLKNTHERLMKIYYNIALSAKYLPGELFETTVGIFPGDAGA
ncbi:MAG: hypothetical protein ACI9C4_001862 [Paraglaciecola sp.]|jgi:hypothetical protein